MKKIRIIVAVALAVMFCLAMVACNQPESTPSSSVASIYSLPSVNKTSVPLKSEKWTVEFEVDSDVFIETQTVDIIFQATKSGDTNYLIIMEYKGSTDGKTLEELAADYKAELEGNRNIEALNFDFATTDMTVGGYSTLLFEYDRTYTYATPYHVRTYLIDVDGEYYRITQSYTIRATAEDPTLIDPILESIKFVAIAG